MRSMTAKYGGRCRGCGQRFPAGTRILWSRDLGAVVDTPEHGACQDAAWGSAFGIHEAAQERAAYAAEMAAENAERRMVDAEIRAGEAEVAQIQAVTAPGSALREAMYLDMERAAYDRGDY
jgi:hypothetical protein